MGFFDQAGKAIGIGGGGQRPNVELSEVGDKKLSELTATGAEYIVLSAVKRHAPCTADEISKDQQVKLTTDQVRDVLTNLYSKGWIKKSRMSGE